MLQYKHIGITVKPNLTEKDVVVQQVLNVLRESGAEVFVDTQAMRELECTRMFQDISTQEHIDLMVVIGGDGTILRTVRQFASKSVPVLGINRGVLGFLAEVSIEEIADVLPSLLQGDGLVDVRRMLDISVQRNDKEVFSSIALNEAVIAQGTIARLLDLRTDVSGEFLATFHADGLIVATPTGSTAYSLAAGGPVVHPSLEALILSPINPHSLTQKPVVIPGRADVRVEVQHAPQSFHDAHVGLTIDGQLYFELSPEDCVHVRMSAVSAHLLRRKQDRFFLTLRSKLRWGEGI